MRSNAWGLRLFTIALTLFGCKSVSKFEEDAGDDTGEYADSDADTDGDGDMDADSDSGSDADTDTDSDIDTDEDGDSDAPSDTEKGSEPPHATDTGQPTDTGDPGETDTASEFQGSATGSEQIVDDACLDGYDSASPALRIRSFVPVQPAGLSGATFTTPVQEALDGETVIYLLAMEGIQNSTGSYPLQFGAGSALAREGTYAFTGSPAPTELQVVLSGTGFTSEASGENITLVFPLSGSTNLEIPVQELVLSGTFTTSERCSIGSALTEGPPSTWEEGGQISGLITVEDAEDASIQYMSFDFSLCAFLAYGLTGILMGNQECTGDPSSWGTPPDETTVDGDPAWRLVADYAATAVLLDD